MRARKDIEDLIAQHRTVFAECHQILDNVQKRHRDFWRERAGHEVDLMVESRAKAVEFLSDPRPAHRSAALAMLMYEWKAAQDADFRKLCEALALYDPSDDVRQLALIDLGSCYEDTSDPRVGKLLAQIVVDSTLSDKIRAAAYSSLFALCGKRDENIDLFMNFQFSRDVDWQMVEQFLTDRPPASRTKRAAKYPAPLSESESEGVTFFEAGLKASTEGDPTRAVEAFSQAIQRMPMMAGTYLHRGRALAGLGRIKEALSDFTTAIELSPDSPTAYECRADAYSQLGRADLAELDRRTAQVLQRGV